MKITAALFALSAAVAEAHYIFPALIAGSTVTSQWQYVRRTKNYYSNGPVTDVTNVDIRCYQDPAGPAAQTYTVAAGSQVGMTAVASVSHPGTLQFYMAKCPSSGCTGWDGSGSVWFKTYSQGPVISGGSMSWPSSGATQVKFTVPSCLPSGQYLVRVEHIALHSASTAGGAQFYISCGQINVTGGGSKTPSGLVAFPGAYKATDPGIMINIYYPVPTSYTAPGPAVFTC